MSHEIIITVEIRDYSDPSKPSIRQQKRYTEFVHTASRVQKYIANETHDMINVLLDVIHEE